MEKKPKASQVEDSPDVPNNTPRCAHKKAMFFGGKKKGLGEKKIRKQPHRWGNQN